MPLPHGFQAVNVNMLKHVRYRVVSPISVPLALESSPCLRPLRDDGVRGVGDVEGDRACSAATAIAAVGPHLAIFPCFGGCLNAESPLRLGIPPGIGV